MPEVRHKSLAAFGDIPLEDDSTLGHEWAQVTELHRLVTSGPTQQTIAVSGSWGSGKTSLMRLVKNRIDEDQSGPTVWFNLWRFEREADLVVPLLATIEQDLLDGGWLNDKESLRSRISQLAAAVLRASVIRTGFVDLHLSEFAADFFSPDEDGRGRSDAGRYFGFVRELEAIIDALRDEADQSFRIVIFIDDVDRCLAPATFRMMETVKVMFDIPGVTFVVGVAEEQLVDAVESHYQEQGSFGQLKVEHYVEKLFQRWFPVDTALLQFTIVNMFEQVTGCEFLQSSTPLSHDDSRGLLGRDEASIGRLCGLDFTAGERISSFLSQILMFLNLRGPRPMKLWIDAIDGYLHRYAVAADRRHKSFRWWDVLSSPADGLALRALADLVIWIQAGGDPGQADLIKLALADPATREFWWRDEDTEIEFLWVTFGGHGAEFEAALAAFRAPTTIEIEPWATFGGSTGPMILRPADLVLKD